MGGYEFNLGEIAGTVLVARRTLNRLRGLLPGEMNASADAAKMNLAKLKRYWWNLALRKEEITIFLEKL